MSICAPRSAGSPRPSGRRAVWLLAMLLSLPACSAGGDREPRAQTHPRRIISLVPAVTEMLFALGAGERVVAVSDFDTYPPEVGNLPKVGALLDPNVESILRLQPDLVVAYGTQSALAENLKAAGIGLFPFVSGSIGDMLAALEALGAATGRKEAGRKLAAGIAATLEDVRSHAPGDRPTVLLVHSRDAGTMGGFYTEGGPSYFNELIRIAGGENLFADVPIKAFQPSLEEILERRPEVILELLPSRGGAPAALRQRLDDWSRLETLPAVTSGRVHVLADDYLLLNGPRIHLVAARLAEAIHPRPAVP